MELNEKMYSTQELKAQASKLPEEKIISLSSITGYSHFTPDEKAIFKYNINRYNSAAKEYNKLRQDMIVGRVPDSENSKVAGRLKKLHTQVKRLYTKGGIADSIRAGASKSKAEELRNIQKSTAEKTASEKADAARQLSTFKDKVREYSKKARGK